MINGFDQMGDCGYDVCGDDIPDEYQVARSLAPHTE